MPPKMRQHSPNDSVPLIAQGGRASEVKKYECSTCEDRDVSHGLRTFFTRELESPNHLGTYDPSILKLGSLLVEPKISCALFSALSEFLYCCITVNRVIMLLYGLKGG